MDVREKLIEILRKPIFPHELADPIEAVADYLLDSGVTVQENMEISDELLKQLKNAPITNWKEEPSIEVVQEWISVDDRLPENGKEGVLIALRWGEVDIGLCEDGRWRSEFVNEYEDGEVTHWMPIPHPPKGGNMQ